MSKAKPRHSPKNKFYACPVLSPTNYENETQQYQL
jgi:hypothetical protein